MILIEIVHGFLNNCKQMLSPNFRTRRKKRTYHSLDNVAVYIILATSISHLAMNHLRLEQAVIRESENKR